jgi:NADPH-dependent F420 reductase
VEVGIFGGTGPAGRGLAVRLAAAGVPVVIGSRQEQRAREIAVGLVDRWGKRLTAPLTGHANEEAAHSELLVVATPWDSALETIRALRDRLAGKVVVSMVNALVKEGREMRALIPARGSMAAEIQAVLRESQVSAALHHLPASEMEDLDSGLISDVLVCSDHAEAAEKTIQLIDRIDGLRALHAGSLAQASAIEAFTAVCITLNIRHRVHSTLRLGGI